MRILLDACVPRRLRKSLSGHDVRTAPEMGWGDLNNGALLDAMAADFDALVTVDKRLSQQQRVEGRAFGIVVLRARSNRLSDLLPLVPGLREALSALKPGVVDEVASYPVVSGNPAHLILEPGSLDARAWQEPGGSRAGRAMLCS